MRIGQGIDVHAFGPGDHVMLCGVRVPHDQGFIAHSDGDVALHALMDALLGALGLGDIGQHFPPDDDQYHNADSGMLLQRVCNMIENEQFEVNNLDLTIMCEAPKILPHRETMVKRVAQLMKISRAQVSIKATTTEKLGFTGRKEGIAAMAIVLLSPIIPG
ncbi:MAG: 2-C-methyl-D-erythritol 2,4-cyclodiphosphate synthase [bacterium]